MNKTLYELLNEKKYEKLNVKIGSKSGSSFWYCGKGDKKFSFPAIKSISRPIKKQNQKKLEIAEKRLEHLDEIYDKNIDDKIKQGKVKDIEKYLKAQNEKREGERRRLPKRIEELKQEINKTLLDRKVKEVVKGISPDEQPCEIIYVEGHEIGLYWTIEEYNKRRRTYED